MSDPTKPVVVDVLALMGAGVDPQPIPSDFPSPVVNLRVPVFGRLRLLKNMQGIIQLNIIVLYWIFAVSSSGCLILWPRWNEGFISTPFIMVYLLIMCLCLLSLFRASSLEPGQVTEKHQEFVDQITWTFCHQCKLWRPPRAHHCRCCRHCVLRMDHHCPWINNCVGEENHYAFMQLLFYAVIVSSMALMIDLMHWYSFPLCQYCSAQDHWYTQHEYGIIIVNIVLAIFMMLASSMLFMVHHISQILDLTTIDWLKIQSMISSRTYTEWPPKVITNSIRPCCVAYQSVCGKGNLLLWANPCRKRKARLAFYYAEVV